MASDWLPYACPSSPPKAATPLLSKPLPGVANLVMFTCLPSLCLHYGVPTCPITLSGNICSYRAETAGQMREFAHKEKRKKNKVLSRCQHE